jgi:hypothetical protein
MTVEKFFIAFVSLAFLGILSWGLSIHFSRKKRVVNDYSPQETRNNFASSFEANLPSSESSFSDPIADTGPTSGPTMSNHALRNNSMRGKGITQTSGPQDTGPTGPKK